jgi:hypothetical protein
MVELSTPSMGLVASRAQSHNREASQIVVSADARLHSVSILADSSRLFLSGAEHAQPET